jgi:hypothetical protein
VASNRARQTDKHKLIYEGSDGARSSRDVAKIAGVSPNTVSVVWREWLAAGICAEAPGQAGRARQLVPRIRLCIPMAGLPSGAAVAGPAAGEAEAGV